MHLRYIKSIWFKHCKQFHIHLLKEINSIDSKREIMYKVSVEFLN